MKADKEGGGSRELEDYLSRELVALGFDPGIPVYEISNVDFDLGLLNRALFSSLASAPVLLPLEVVVDNKDDATPAEPRRRCWPIPMIVEAVRVVYPPDIVHHDQQWALGCLEQPEWYVTGYVYKAPLHPDQSRIRINAYIRSKGSNTHEIDVVILQLVRQPSTADPTTRLQWGDGIPGSD